MIFMQQFPCKQNQAIFYAIAILFFSTRPCTEEKSFLWKGSTGKSGLLTTTVAVAYARNVAATGVLLHI